MKQLYIKYLFLFFYINLPTFIDEEPTKSNIIKFANKSGIDAGILVGRLQKEHYVNFDTFNDLKKKYKIVNI